jgi:hypothetical protein
MDVVHWLVPRKIVFSPLLTGKLWNSSGQAGALALSKNIKGTIK